MPSLAARKSRKVNILAFQLEWRPTKEGLCEWLGAVNPLSATKGSPQSHGASIFCDYCKYRFLEEEEVLQNKVQDAK